MENDLPKPGKLTEYINKKYLFMYGNKDMISYDENFSLLKKSTVLDCLTNLLNRLISLVSSGYTEKQILEMINNLDLKTYGFSNEEAEYIKSETQAIYKERQNFFNNKKQNKVKIRERRNIYESNNRY